MHPAPSTGPSVCCRHDPLPSPPYSRSHQPSALRPCNLSGLLSAQRLSRQQISQRWTSTCSVSHLAFIDRPSRGAPHAFRRCLWPVTQSLGAAMHPRVRRSGRCLRVIRIREWIVGRSDWAMLHVRCLMVHLRGMARIRGLWDILCVLSTAVLLLTGAGIVCRAMQTWRVPL